MESSVQRGLKQALQQASKTTKKNPELVSTDSDGSSKSGSPDQCCSICLSKFKDESFSDGCFHRFCFQCIREWAKVKSTCPLCKAPFKSIIHNVKSSDVYDQYVLQPADNGSFGVDGGGRRFRYHTTILNNRRSAWESRMDQLFNRQARLAERMRQENEARQRRQLIYAAGLRVRHIGANRFTRFRDISPEFFCENPAMTHRLIPWLRRDLSVLLNGNEDHVTFMTQYIVSLIPNVDIQTEEFHNHLRPFLYGHTEHFIHEFTNFARSPYDMATYDQMAQYDFSAATHQISATLRSHVPLVAQDNSSSDDSDDNNHSNNNEVIVISSDDEIDGNPVQGSTNVGQSVAEAIQAVHNIPGPSSAAQDHQDVAGPSSSFDLSSTHNPEPPVPPDHNEPGPSGVNLANVQIKREQDSLPANPEEDKSEDSSGSVEIVGYQKPFHLRTPIAVITISDDSSEAEEPPANTHKLTKKAPIKPTGESSRKLEKAGGKRKQKTKHTRSRSPSKSRSMYWTTDSDDSYYYRSRRERYSRRRQRSGEKTEKSSQYSRSSYDKEYRDRSRSPNELYRKVREGRNKWSLYYESKHSHHSTSRSLSSTKTKGGYRSRSRSRSGSRSRSRSISKSYYSYNKYFDDLQYDRSREHSRDNTWRGSSRDRSYRRRSRSRSRGRSNDAYYEESRNDSKYRSRYNSTSSTLSRHSYRDKNLSRRDDSGPDPVTTHRRSPSPQQKRKKNSDEEQRKEEGDLHHSKKHKHKHKHHKKKRSKHRSKDKEGKHKHKEKTTKNQEQVISGKHNEGADEGHSKQTGEDVLDVSDKSSKERMDVDSGP